MYVPWRLPSTVVLTLANITHSHIKHHLHHLVPPKLPLGITINGCHYSPLFPSIRKILERPYRFFQLPHLTTFRASESSNSPANPQFSSQPHLGYYPKMAVLTPSVNNNEYKWKKPKRESRSGSPYERPSNSGSSGSGSSGSGTGNSSAGNTNTGSGGSGSGSSGSGSGSGSGTSRSSSYASGSVARRELVRRTLYVDSLVLIAYGYVGKNWRKTRMLKGKEFVESQWDEMKAMR